MPDYDSPWKDAIEQFFEPMVALFFPEAHAGIDWSRGYEFLDKEMQAIAVDAESGRRTVDKLVKVWKKNGGEEWVLIHIEVQGDRVTDFEVRMYQCNYRAFDHYHRKVASFGILTDQSPGWRPSAYGYNLWGTKLQFEFPIVKLLDLAADEAALEKNPNPIAPVVLAQRWAQQTAGDNEKRKVWKIRLVRSLYERGLTKEDVQRLFRLVNWFMTLPKEMEKLVWREVEAFEKEKNMPYVTNFERVVYEEGEAAGRAAGEAAGRAAGEVVGRAAGLRQAIELLLRSRFAIEGQRLAALVQHVTDLDRLQAILPRVADVATAEEAEAILTRQES